MDRDTQKLEAALAEVELVAEHLLLARQQMMQCDKARNANREALTALRKQARTSRTSVPERPRSLITEIDENWPASKCLTCGEHDPAAPMYLLGGGSDVFVRLPFHEVHCLLEKEQESLERSMKQLQSTVKEKTMALSDKGGLSDIVSLVYLSHS